MTDGVYDIDGKCVNCKEYHPCSCEIATIEEDWDPAGHQFPFM